MRLSLLLTALRELGWEQIGLNLLYRLGLRLGAWRWLTSVKRKPCSVSLSALLPIPDPTMLRSLMGEEGIAAALKEADELVEAGLFSPFGGEKARLNLSQITVEMLQHWTQYETGKAGLPVEDVKLIWEAGRLGWAYRLARAYVLSGDERYRVFFWQRLVEFLESNPPMLGPHWMSGQETAIRLVAMAWMGAVFLAGDPQAEQHRQLLAQAIHDHARRIPPTLLYARSQFNNHLVTESLGLIVAARVLPEAPEALSWRRTGWHWLNHALETQINAVGEYAQHSNNYHRLMLQCACLAAVLAQGEPFRLSDKAKAKLKSAAVWLSAEVEPHNGQVALYGHNDGAYLFPLDSGGFDDYRMIIQAASRLFGGENLYPVGRWDEFQAWLGLEPEAWGAEGEPFRRPAGLLKAGTTRTWARLRSNYHTSRPAHADQLHMDLWWKGSPVALDAGTYRYTSAAPWDNRLAGTAVHNTVMVDGCDQMRRVGRFLWLEWAQACAMQTESPQQSLQGEHNGYRHMAILHRRRVDWAAAGEWLVTDLLYQPQSVQHPQSHKVRVHWLLPDGRWRLEGTRLEMAVPQGQFSLAVSAEDGQAGTVTLCRAGEVLYGPGDCQPQLGWVSPYYNEKIPALSFAVEYQTKLPASISSRWTFSD